MRPLLLSFSFLLLPLFAGETYNAAALKVNLKTVSVKEVEAVFADSYVLIQDKLKRGELKPENIQAAVRAAWTEALETATQDAILDQRADKRRKEIMRYYLERAGQETSGERAAEAFRRLESDYVRRLRREMMAAAGGEEELRNTLKRRGQTLQDWEAGLSRELFRRDVVAIELGPIICSAGAIRAFYEKHPELFRQPETWRLRRIRIAKSKFSSAAVALEAAKLVHDELKKGGDFAALATKVSADPEFARQGGLLSRGETIDLPSGAFPVEEKIAADLKESEFSAPVECGDIIVIVQLLAYRAGGLEPYEKASERAEALAYAEKLKQKKQELFQKLKKESYVEVLQKDPPAHLLKQANAETPIFLPPDQP